MICVYVFTFLHGNISFFTRLCQHVLRITITQFVLSVYIVASVAVSILSLLLLILSSLLLFVLVPLLLSVLLLYSHYLMLLLLLVYYQSLL